MLSDDTRAMFEDVGYDVSSPDESGFSLRIRTPRTGQVMTEDFMVPADRQNDLSALRREVDEIAGMFDPDEVAAGMYQEISDQFSLEDMMYDMRWYGSKIDELRGRLS